MFSKELLIFALLVPNALALSCKCREIDLLMDMYMEERMNRIDIEARLERLEARTESVPLSKSAHTEQTLEDEKLVSIEKQMEALNREVQETNQTCQQSARDVSRLRYDHFAFRNAWVAQKRGIDRLEKMDAALTKAIQTQKLKIRELPRTGTEVVQKSTDISELIMERIKQLENETSENQLVASANRDQILVLKSMFFDEVKSKSLVFNHTLERVDQIASSMDRAMKQCGEAKVKVEALETRSSANTDIFERKMENKFQDLKSQMSGSLENVKTDVYQNFTTLRTNTEESFRQILTYLQKPRTSNLQVNIDAKSLSSTIEALFGIRVPDVSGIAFTAYGSKRQEIFSKASIRFDNVLLNAGGHYNVDRGMFVCPQAGLYHFAVTLTKVRQDIDLVTAYLCVDDETKLQLHSDPDDPGTTDFGSYSISGAGTFYLKQNDWVYIRGTSSYFYDDNRSFFTGFLVA